METWVKINGFSRYECSNYGNIRSLNYKNSGKTVMLKPAKSTDGYYKTVLQKDSGKYSTIAVHRIVLNSFIPKPGPEFEVNHINGNKADNSIQNLEWLTHSDNCQHSFDTGLQKPKRGELNGMAKLTEPVVVYLRYLKCVNGRYWGRNEFAQKLGMNAKHLQKLVNSRVNW